MYARRRYNMLRALINAVGIDPRRVKFTFVSAAEGAKFAQTVTEFIKEVQTLGPNPLKAKQVKEA